MKAKKWTKQENKILKQGYKKGVPMKEIAKSLGRTFWSIHGQAKKMGLRHATRWSPEEDEILVREHIKNGKSAREVCKILGRSAGRVKDGAVVKERARRLGLSPIKEREKVRREFMESHLRTPTNRGGLYFKDLPNVFGLCYMHILTLAKKWNFSTVTGPLPVELNPRATPCYVCGRKHLNKHFCSRNCEAFPLFLIPKLWGFEFKNYEKQPKDPISIKT